ncbi:MAG: GntR family transcriptional regulator [Sporolactobacillus sp.]
MDIVLRNSADEPIYRQIRNQIAEQVLSGILAEGAQLPSIRGLARELRVSVITTKRAYEELEHEGYIDTVPGKGTFVSLHNQAPLRQQQQEAIAEQLRQVIAKGKKAGLSLDELLLLVRSFYEEM